MDQHPDKLFREKLHAYETPVPPQVWSRVAAQRPFMRKSDWWLKAAAVAAIGSAALLLYPFNQDSKHSADDITRMPRQEQSTATKRPDTGLAHGESAAGKKQNPTQDSTAPARAFKEPSRMSATQPREATISSNNTEGAELIIIPEPDRLATAAEDTVRALAEEKTTRPASPGRKTITIVLSANEVNEKYLSKADVPHATFADEQASALRNVLDKAYDLTQNRDPVGELRQKKNEILAMNFGKDRPRTQND